MATFHDASTGLRLLCVAPLSRPGGVDTLLTAFGILAGDRPDLSVDVVGAGPLSSDLHAQASYLGVAEQVRLRGGLTAPAVRRAVRGCAVLVLPHRDAGHATDRTAEVALLEALARGCPVVATTPAAPPCARLDPGMVVPPDAPTALAQALHAALREPRCADRHRAAGTDPTTAPEPGGARHLLRRTWHCVTR